MNIWSIIIGLSVGALGLAGLVAPTDLGTVAQNATTPIGIYLVAIVRLLVGVTLFREARRARIPIVLQVVGVLAIIGALLMPVLGFDRNEAIVNWWVAQGPQMIRMTGVAGMAIGALIVFSANP